MCSEESANSGRATITPAVGIYSEYLDKKLDFPTLTKERKRQLQRIS